MTKNMSAELINRMLNTLGEFVLRAVMIRVLGEQFLGLNGLFSSILALLNVAELGFGSAITYSMYKPIAEGDMTKINALLQLYRKVYRIIAFVILGLGICLIPVLPNLINGSVPKDVNLYVLYLIYLINAVAAYLFGAYRSGIFIAYQVGRVRATIKSFVYVLITLIQIVALFVFENYYFYVILFPIGTLVRNILIYIISKKIYPDIQPCGVLADKEKKDVHKKVVGLSVYQIGGAIYSYADTIVISAFLGLTILAKYTNYYYIIIGLNAIIDSIKNAITPSIGNSIVIETKEKNIQDFDAINYIFIWGIGWAAICLLCLYQPFMTIWMGEGMLFDESILPIFAIYFYIMNCTAAVGIYKNAAGVWWEDRIRPIIGTIVNLLLNIILVQYIGLYGVLLSSIVSTAFISVPFAAYYLFKMYLNISVWKYLYVQLKGFLQFCIAGFVTYEICINIPDVNIYVSLLIRGCISLFIPNAIFFLFSIVFKEWKLLSKYIKAFLGSLTV